MTTTTEAESTTTDGAVREPYQGLEPYEEKDEPYFFGRTRQVEAIFERLFASRLTIVYGASGVGKSSILRAGVVKRLKVHERAQPVLVSRWGAHPIDSISAVLDAILDRKPLESLEQRLRRAVSAKRSYIMVILDQFEEMLREVGQSTPAGELDALIDLIASLTREEAGVSFIVALRADALADADMLIRRLDDRFTPLMYRVDPMNSQGGKEAIEEPVRHHNMVRHESVKVQPELTRQVLSGVSNAAGDEVDLPYLQIVMKRLWEAERSGANAESGELRLSTLNNLGGTRKIVDDHVRQILDGLSYADRALAIRLLDKLVTPTGAKVRFSVADLAQFTRANVPDVRRVLEKLSGGESRLLRTGDGSSDSYELFHDRLVEPVAKWTAERQRAAYHRRVLGVAIAASIAVSVTAVLVLRHILTDHGPPRADIESVTIEGGGNGLDASILNDGNDTNALIIPLGDDHRSKIKVTFAQVTDIVDVQVVPSRDHSIETPAPLDAFIAETRIEIPVGEDDLEGRGAYGRTKQVTLIVEGSELDSSVQVAELKFWRAGS